MSEHDQTFDDCDRICPYCSHAYQVEAEDYNESRREEKCDECGKKFYAWESFSVTHYALPDCQLNGQQHDYQSMSIRDGKTHPFCTVCGKCQPHKEVNS